MTKIFEVMYVSQLASDIPVTAVSAIMSTARSKNHTLDVTGLLVFDGQRFCQQLEGPQKAVIALLDLIREDPRHTGVEVLHHGPLDTRRFRRFTTGYASQDNGTQLAALEALDGEPAVQRLMQMVPHMDLD